MTTATNTSQKPDPTKLSAEDLPDIQGLIVRGYRLPQVRHFVLTIDSPVAAASFFEELTSGSGSLSITSAEPWKNNTKPAYALNLGVTASGLEALHLPGPTADPEKQVSINKGNFSSFLGGAVAAADTVGDTGDNTPENWIPKLNTANSNAAHLVLSLYTTGKNDRERYSEILRGMYEAVIPPAGSANHEVLEFDVDVLPDSKIHFGYTDSISNPIIDTDDSPPLRDMQLPYVPAWQFVLRDGRETSYNMPGPIDFSQNASFSAFRILEQNVDAFDAFLKTQGGGEGQEALAAAMCGRWRNGNPLVASPTSPGSEELPPDQLRDFLYNAVATETDQPDTKGYPCPYSAHTRRVNPRGGPGVVGVQNTEEGRQSHRIMRRANPYGPVYSGQPDDEARGLAGHFIGALLSDQFEFLMGQWVNSGTFAGNKKAGIDPLLGNQPDGSSFTYNKENSETGELEEVTVANLTRFVTTKGGLYIMLPSLTAIKWMSLNCNNSDPWTIANNS